jgi:hypothetical protein
MSRGRSRVVVVPALRRDDAGFVNAVDNDAPLTAVILREGGVSSMPRVFDSITSVSEYWIVRLRGR